MTSEEVLDFPAKRLEEITDKEWLAFIEPYLRVTRPELAEKPVKSKSSSSNNKVSSGYDYQRNQKKSKAQCILSGLGIDLEL